MKEKRKCPHCGEELNLGKLLSQTRDMKAHAVYMNKIKSEKAAKKKAGKKKLDKTKK